MRPWYHHLLKVSTLYRNLYMKHLTDGDMVVIVDGDQVAELQVTGERRSFASNAFLGASIAEKDVSVVIDQVVARLIEQGAGVSLSNCETHGVGEALAERSSRDLNTGSVVAFGMAGGYAVHLLLSLDYRALANKVVTYSEVLQVIHRDLVAEQMQESILKHAAMSVPTLNQL